MKFAISRLYVGLRQVMEREDGADLVQVGLLVALVAVGATAGFSSVAMAVGSAFNSLGSMVAHSGGVVIQ